MYVSLTLKLPLLFYSRFLRVKKFNVRKASKMMDKYLAMRCDNPHWFMDLDPTNNLHMQELVSSSKET